MTARYFSADTLRLLGRWLAWSAPIPYVLLWIATLASGGISEDAPGFAVFLLIIDVLHLLPLALTLAGWIALLRWVPRCATSRAWHAGSLVALIVLTANGLVLSLWAIDAAFTDEPRYVRDAYQIAFQASLFGGAVGIGRWLNFVASPVLVVVVPRLLLARQLRAAALVAYR